MPDPNDGAVATQDPQQSNVPQNDAGLAATVSQAMAAPGANNTPPPQTGPPQGGMSALAGGKGFFRGLLGTLLQGAAVATSASVQTPQGPNQIQRAAATATQDPRINPQARQQQLNAQQMEHLKLAQAQVNLQQTYHMMLNDQEAQQNEAYTYERDYWKQVHDQGKAEILGENTDRSQLTAKLNQLRSQHKNDPQGAFSVAIHPSPDSTPASKKWAIIRSIRGPLDDDVTVDMKGDKDSGLPDKTFTSLKGTSTADSWVDWSDKFKTHMMNKSAAMNSPASTDEAPPQRTAGELSGLLKQRGIMVPENMDEIWAVANGKSPLKDVGAKTSPRELNRTQTEAFIRKYINPNFDPQIVERAVENEAALLKAENTYPDKNGETAATAVAISQRIIDDPKSPPEQVQRAMRLLPDAKTMDQRYQKSLQEKQFKYDATQQTALYNERIQNGIDKEGKRLTIDEAPSAMMVDSLGNPIPEKLQNVWKPGQMQQNTAATARVVREKLEEIRDEVKKNPDLIGPLMGNSKSALSSLGLGDAKAQRLLNDLTTVQSGFTKMHTSRFSSEILAKATKMIRAGMNNDQFNGALESMIDTAQMYEKEDKPMSVGEYQVLQRNKEAQAKSVNKIRVKLANGKVGRLDPKDFDPNTMQRLDQ
jgi:hypothetical protein